MRSRFDRLLLPAPKGPGGIIRKLITLVFAILLIGVAFMFSAVVLAALVVIASIGGAWLWWKTRKLRKQLNQALKENGSPFERMMQQNTPPHTNESFKGEIIEGEVIRKEHEPFKP